MCYLIRLIKYITEYNTVNMYQLNIFMQSIIISVELNIEYCNTARRNDKSSKTRGKNKWFGAAKRLWQ